MEGEPAERVTTHHRSVGKEGLRRRGWNDGAVGVGVVGAGPWLELALMEGIMTLPILPSQLYITGRIGQIWVVFWIWICPLLLEMFPRYICLCPDLKAHKNWFWVKRHEEPFPKTLSAHQH